MLTEFLTSYSNSRTRTAYKTDLTLFLDWLLPLTIHEVTPLVLNNYRTWLNQDRAPSTVNRMLAALRAYGQWLASTEQADLKATNALQGVRGVTAHRPLPNLLEENEIKALLAQPDEATEIGRRDAALLHLLFTSGLRVSEALDLKIEAIRWSERSAIISGKGNKQRKVFFSLRTAEKIQNYTQSRKIGFVFLNKNGQRLSVRWVEKALKEYGKQIGRNDVHPHLLRHQFATKVLNKTKNLRMTGDLLGHVNLQTTAIYTRLATDYYQAEYENIFE